MKSRGAAPAEALSPGAYSFGPFRLDLRKRRLWKGDELVALTPKALETLLALLRHAGHVVDKDDLLRIVWPDTFVTEETLTQNIATIRRALGDSSEHPEFIATIPRRGYQFIGVVTHDAAAGALPSAPLSASSVETRDVSSFGRSSKKPLLIGFALLVLGFGLAVAYWVRARSSDLGPPVLVRAPAGETLTGSIAVSPSGKRLTFITAGLSPQQSRMWLRTLGEVAARPLLGTEGAAMPFWSPDETRIGFFAERKLKIIQLDSGQVTTIAAVGRARGGTWSRQGLILFAPDIDSPIYSISASGGPVTPVTDLNDGPDHRFPFFLPDGQHFLYLVLAEDRDKSEVRWGRVGGPEGGSLFNAGSAAVYLSEGLILFARGGSLLAQRFDAARLQSIGRAFVVSEIVGVYGEDGPTGLGMFSGGNDVVALMDTSGPARQLWWLDREGRPLSAIGPPGDYMHVDLSPDGSRAAVVRVDPRKRASDLVVIDLNSGVQTELTNDPQPDSDPLWSPRGERIAFGSLRHGRWRGFVRDVTRAGEDKALPDVCISVSAWFPNDRSVLCTTLGTTTSLVKVDVDGDPSPTVIATGLGYGEARVSRDGSWLAYSSDQEGRSQLFVMRLNGGNSKPIPIGPGVSPRWGSDGRDLFFLSDRTVMRVSLDAVTGALGSRQRLFDTPFCASDSLRDFAPSFAISSDGSRFLMLAPTADASPSAIRILSPWSTIIPKSPRDY